MSSSGAVLSSPIPGRYESVSVDKFDELLQAMGKLCIKDMIQLDSWPLPPAGVNFLLRKVAKVTSPTEIFAQNVDGSYTFRMLSTFKNQEYTFKLGVPLKETRLDGKQVWIVIVIEEPEKEGDDVVTLLTKQYADESLQELLVTIRRQFRHGGTGESDTNYGLIATAECKGVVSVRKFRRLE